MFIIPCKFTNDSPIFECIESIISHHPNEKIVVVDSYSEDLSYIDKIKNLNNVSVLEKKNKHYEFGALKLCYEKYPNEKKYCLIHDSIIIKNSLSTFLQDDKSYSIMYFYEHVTGDIQNLSIEHFFKNTNYNFTNKEIYGCFGTMAIITNKIMKKFEKNKLFENLLPTNKFESQITERILGFCLNEEGCDIKTNSVEGDFLSKYTDVINHNLHYITKIFIKRD